MFLFKEKKELQIVIEGLQSDGVMLSPSDTVLGLFAQLSEKSKNKLDLIKQRDIKPYIILLSSAHLLYDYIDQDLDSTMKKIITTYWPGPLTIIFKAKTILPDWLQGQDGTIAIRVPQHETLQQILEHVDSLFSTSANISGEVVATKIADVHPLIKEKVDMVCGDHHVSYNEQASTIIDFSTGVLQILRQGAVKLDSI